MKTSREEIVERDSLDPKRRRGAEESSALAFDSPLQVLANYDDDDDGDVVYARRGATNGSGGEGETGGKSEHNVSGERSDGDSEEEEEAGNWGRTGLMIEVRRDCPYLDTVNRQVHSFSHHVLMIMSILTKFCIV